MEIFIKETDSESSNLNFGSVKQLCKNITKKTEDK
jgi:hypothetical protein